MDFFKNSIFQQSQFQCFESIERRMLRKSGAISIVSTTVRVRDVNFDNDALPSLKLMHCLLFVDINLKYHVRTENERVKRFYRAWWQQQICAS